MKHLGDITLIKGNEAPTVDCIIGGSPCQDLSLAGERAGLAGARSGLYMEQIRIIKEMREEDVRRGKSDVDVRPRYMVWENVPGAFSTNQGKDFAAVLEEAIRVAEPQAPDVPVPEKGWPTSGCFMGECWSVAWRVLDAQFWGTSNKPLPQRRRRIALVADFGGQSAPEILFVRKGVSGNIEPGEPKRKEAPGDAGEGSGGASDSVVYGISPYHSNCMKSDNPTSGYYEAETSRSLDAMNCGYPGCNQGGMAVVQPVTFEPGIASREGGHVYNGVSGTLRANAGDNQMSVVQPIAFQGWAGSAASLCIGEDVCSSLVSKKECMVAYSIENHPADSRVDIDESGKVQTLTSRMGTGGGNVPMAMVPVGINGDIAGTLDSSYYKGCGMRQGIEREVVVQLASGKDVTGCLMASGYDKLGAQEMFSGDYTVIETQVESIPYAAQSYHEIKESPVGASLKASGGVLGGGSENFVVTGVDCRNATEYEEQTGTLQADCCHNHNSNNVVRVRHIVRRLTPLECERLQGFPDGWTDIGEWVDSKGKKHKEADSPRYKALGNSIALPPWKWVLKRLCACYERDATMASLFDGIGGFPYIWEQLNGKGSCLWASEIEEFPMAVTKLRFGGNDNV